MPKKVKHSQEEINHLLDNFSPIPKGGKTWMKDNSIVIVGVETVLLLATIVWALIEKDKKTKANSEVARLHNDAIRLSEMASSYANVNSNLQTISRNNQSLATALSSASDTLSQLRLSTINIFNNNNALRFLVLMCALSTTRDIALDMSSFRTALTTGNGNADQLFASVSSLINLLPEGADKDNLATWIASLPHADLLQQFTSLIRPDQTENNPYLSLVTVLASPRS